MLLPPYHASGSLILSPLLLLVMADQGISAPIALSIVYYQLSQFTFRLDIFNNTFMVLKIREKIDHSGSTAQLSALIIKHTEVLRDP